LRTVRLASLVLPLVLALVAPASVAAATVTTSGDCDKYGDCGYRNVLVAAPGEVNVISLSFQEPAPRGGERTVLIRDAGAILRPGRLCDSRDPHTVSCLTSLSVEVRAGDGDDSIDATGAASEGVVLRGGPGRDRLIGDARGGVLAGDEGLDVLEGGPGDDVLLGRDGDDRMAGGSGRDVLRGGDGDDVLGGYGEETLGSVGPAPVDRGADLLDCGAGKDAVEPADVPSLVILGCEALYAADDFRALPLRSARVPTLGLRRDLLGPPSSVEASVRIRGSERVERSLRLSVPRSAGQFAAGSRRLRLDSERIRAQRRRKPVVIEMRIRGRLRGSRRVRFRADFQIRLPRSTG